MKIQFTKRNKLICLITLLMIILIPVEFTWDDPAIEYLRFEGEDMFGLLFWLYFASAVGACMSSCVERYDIAKYLSLLSLILIIILVLGTLRGHITLQRFLTSTNIAAYGYLGLTAVLFFVIRNADKLVTK